MRKLAWFSGACLWACYDIGPVQLLGTLLLALGGWLATRPSTGHPPLSPPPTKDKGPLSRYVVFQVSRRALALCLGAVLAFGWAGAYFALFRAPAQRWVGDQVALSGEVSSYPAPTSIGGYSVRLLCVGHADVRKSGLGRAPAGGPGILYGAGETVRPRLWRRDHLLHRPGRVPVGLLQ